MVSLVTLFQKGPPLKVLVAGDLLLDRYTLGSARRISPESPVPVVNVQKEEQRAGGAGNVMLNLRALGANVVALGRVGNDAAGNELRKELERHQIDTKLLVEDTVPTPVKQRIIAQGQQLVRVDREVIAPLGREAEKKLIDSISSTVEWCQVIAISDYAKGTLSDALLTALIQEAKAKNIPVIVDPKGLDYRKYSGVTLLKPNLSEAYAVVGADDATSLEDVANRLKNMVDVKTVMITRSGEGISFWEKEQHYHRPAQVREVVDVTGAGDTVLAAIALALGHGLSTLEAAELANIAAGIAVERLGCACIGKQEIAERLLDTDSGSKLIATDEHHFLQAALKGGRPTVVLIDTKAGFDQASHKILCEAKKEGVPCIVCSLDQEPCFSVVELVTSLKEVDYFVSATEAFIHTLDPGNIVHLDHAIAT